jgi:hypothetical protein
MKPLSALLSALALAVFLAPPGLSQDKEQDKGESKEPSYYPLHVGTQWTYKTSDGKTTLIKVTGKEKVGDVDCSRLEATVNGAPVANEHLAAKSDGIYRYKGNGMKVEPPVMVLKLPPKSGEKWEVKSKFAGLTVEGNFTMGEGDVAVTGYKGKAVSVETNDMKIAGNPVMTTLWFAPNVGMVKQVMNLGGMKVQLELEKYEAAKK